jgi:hypothetical protein
MHFISTRIQSTGDSLDISSLACCIPAFIGNDHGNFLAIQTVMQFSQPCLQPIQFFLISIVIQFLIKRDL